MNAIQKISQDLLRECGGTPFDPAGQARLAAASSPQRQHDRESPRKPPVAESVNRLTRLAG